MHYLIRFLIAVGLSISFSVNGITGSLLASEHKTQKPTSWSVFQDPNYGASIYYPTGWFDEARQVDGAYLFMSKTDTARLVFKSFLDPLRVGAAETVNKLKTSHGSHRILDLKSGPMWFEMFSEADQENLIFLKTIYSCKERVVSQFNLVFPKSNRQRYEPILAKMKKRFQAGIGAQTPVNACN